VSDALTQAADSDVNRLTAELAAVRVERDEVLSRVAWLESTVSHEPANIILMRGALRKIADTNWEPGFAIAAARLMQDTAKAALG
jgi:hypothetical protein